MSRLTPLVRRPATKSGPALRPTTATNPASPIDSNTQSVGPGMRPKKRGHIERSQPHTRPPSSTPTLRLNPISMPPSISAGMPTSAPATMPNATSTMSVTSVARSGTPMRATASATRRVGPTRVSDVAAVQLRSPGTSATGVPARVIRRR